MCFEVGRIDGDRPVIGGFRRQTRHDPREHAHIAPPLPAVIERLVRTVLARRVSPAQAIAIDEDNAAQNPSIIDARHAMALGKVRPQPFHLSLAQPV